MKMLCSLCLKQKSKCIQLPCTHIICYSCLPKQSFSQNVFRYQCQTCLSCHQIDLTQQNQMEANNFKEYSLHSSKNSEVENQGQCVFCWVCHEAITLRQYIKGRHHDHSVQTYEQALPSIKELLLNQLQRSLKIKQRLQQNKQNLEDNKLKQSYQNLVDKINEFFHTQMQILQRKRQNILQEVQKFYSSSMKQIQKSVGTLAPLIQDMQNLEQKIQHFLTDELPITQINPISEVISSIDEYLQNSKNKTYLIPQLPQFVQKSTLKDSINQSCQLYVNKKLTEKKLNEFQGKKIKQKQRLGSSLFRMDMKNDTRFGFRKSEEKQVPQVGQRRVRLVEKVKGKMKYTSSMCSTGFA